MYVVCLLFYAIGRFLFICLSPFPDCSIASLGEGRIFYDNIFFTILRNSSLLGKKSSYWETKRLLSMPYVAYSTKSICQMSGNLQPICQLSDILGIGDSTCACCSGWGGCNRVLFLRVATGSRSSSLQLSAAKVHKKNDMCK